MAADGGEMSDDVTLHLGDCLEYVRTMDAGSVDAVITDPPYGVLLGEVNNGQAREKNQQPYSLFSDTPEYIEQLVVPVIELCIQKFGRVVVTPGNRNLWKYPSPDDIGCWYVPAATSRGKWGFACMNPILYYGKSPRAGRGDTPNSVNMQAVRDKTIDHPCPKPLAFMKWLIEKGSKPGDTVFDPFMGSGTTGVACMQTGRKFIGCEIDPGYFAIAEKRIRDAQMQGWLPLIEGRKGA
jgi:site-specific DNA-methyltransferase (adenine-specific)